MSFAAVHESPLGTKRTQAWSLRCPLFGVDRKRRSEAVRTIFLPGTDVELLRQRFDLPQDRGFGNGVSFFSTKVRGSRP
jgi:hypothetical protein